MSRQQFQQLVAIWRELKRGGEESAALDRLQTLLANLAIEIVLEDEVNTALEQSAKGTADDPKQRPV